MYKRTRREKLIQLLRKKNECSVNELANVLKVTRETIRTDLSWLQQHGIVVRHHGGASLRKHLMQNSLLEDDGLNVSQLMQSGDRQGLNYSFIESKSAMSGKVCILGSFNVDIVAKVERFPRDGETLVAKEITFGPGGKGANQALASHRAGAKTHFATKVGFDQFNKFARNHFDTVGIDSFTLYESEDKTTGSAMIYVNEGGENIIAISPGANHQINAEDIDSLTPFISDSDIFMVQMENNIDATICAMKRAHDLNVKTILNPAPYTPDVEKLYQYSDIVTPNESEAEQMAGMKILDINSAKDAAARIHNKSNCSVIITLGKQGALIFDGKSYTHIPSFPAVVVDTTGAGDAFNGALAAYLSKGKSLTESAYYASAYASLAVEKEGAANMPDDHSVQARVSSQKLTLQPL